MRRDNRKNAQMSKRTHVPFLGRAVLVTAAFVAALVLVSTLPSVAVHDNRERKQTSSGLGHC
jgi:hypothetical protein